MEPSDLGQVVTLTETFSSAGHEDATAAVDSTVVIERYAAAMPTKAPVVVGNAAVGETLIGLRGTWSIKGYSFFTWHVDGALVHTGTTYDVRPADLGKRITATETWAPDGYFSASQSIDTAAVISGPAPTPTVEPSVIGTVRVGSTLTADTGTWPVVGRASGVWSVGGRAAGTGLSYTIKPADAGRQLAFTETFVSAGYETGARRVKLGLVPKVPVTLSVATGKAKKGTPLAVFVRTKSSWGTVAGKVSVRYAGRVRTRALANGQVTVKVPAKPKGRYWLTVKYVGPNRFSKISKTLAVRVR